ncbi:Sugar transporter ERD6-like 5 [Citrus sinensis]|uniref:Sugar transporter ERD6-like 5 n=1 Tax=Citrus sinensis TaxID=2711 RepID=A0ACB8KKA9_CITSI|nr:Sugar transporter ERD6-like 5 [Citrus sinensis]
METSESLEEGLIPDPPFLVPRPVITNNEISNGSCLQESDSVATPAVVFSSLVAICGSFLMATQNHYCSNGSLIDYFFQIGYSSPAESGITADLGLSVREACDSICIIVTRQIPIYITEIAPKNVRGAYTATNQATIGKEKELDTTLQRLMGKTADISMESPDIRDYTKTFKNDSRAGIFYLFQRNYAYSLSVGVGLMVMQPLVGSAAIAYYASYIFAAADLLTDIRSISTAIIQASAIGSCLSLSIIALAFCLQDTNHWNEVTPVLAYIGIMESINKPLNFQFSDIFYKHQRFSRKPGDSTPQLQQLDSYIHFPFHDGMEHNSCPIRCISGAGDQGTNT